MRGINKIDGDIHCKDKSEESLDSGAGDSSLFKSHPAAFFATSEASGVGMTKSSVVLKKAYGLCFKNVYAEPLIESGADYLSVTYPIFHQIHRGHSMDKLKWHFTGFNPLNDDKFPLSSHIQFKFFRVESRIYLNVTSTSFFDLFNYNVSELANIITEKSSLHSGSFDISKIHIRVTEKLVNPENGPTDVLVMQRTIGEGQNIKSMLEAVYGYHVNCLKRLEELSCSRDIDAYNVAVQLGTVLSAVVKNYQNVSVLDYQLSLALIDTLEHNSTYLNDPLIWMSMTKIKDALTNLSKLALTSTDGVEVDSEQLEHILIELESHEGVKPIPGNWFPGGTVASLSSLLKTLCPELEFNRSLNGFSI